MVKAPEQAQHSRPTHFEKLNALRAEIDRGIRSLDAGEGSALDIEDFLRRKNLTSKS